MEVLDVVSHIDSARLKRRKVPGRTHFLQRLVVDEACRILREVELAPLDLLAELPEKGKKAVGQ